MARFCEKMEGIERAQVIFQNAFGIENVIRVSHSCIMIHDVALVSWDETKNEYKFVVGYVYRGAKSKGHPLYAAATSKGVGGMMACVRDITQNPMSSACVVASETESDMLRPAGWEDWKGFI